ncbi:MAG: hypothetical protein IJP54_09055 [Synergistaceae bacterium]|nr:hypothetical protein [Synergistaceae bacterium]
MRKLLWRLGGFQARAKHAKLRHRLMWTLCMDEVDGWLRSYGDVINFKEVRL